MSVASGGSTSSGVQPAVRIVFDVGGVLVPFTDQAAEAARLLEVPDRETIDLEPAYWRDRLDWDAGGSDDQYWSSVADQWGVPLRPGMAAQLSDHDCRLWTRIRPSAREILADLRTAGVPAHLLSNAPAAFASALQAAAWRPLVDQIVVSGTIGVVKPNPEIYTHTENQLQTPAGDLAFIDDREHNVLAAQAAGWQAHLWVSDDDTRAWLVSLGVLA